MFEIKKENKIEEKKQNPIAYGNFAKNSLSKGLYLLYKSVKTTYGPNGHTVLIKHPYFSPTITKDGVTVAKSIKSKEPFVDAGIQSIKEVAAKTNQSVGDGTTTATILAYAMYQAYRDHELAPKYQDRQIIKGIKNATDKVIKFINSKSRKMNEKDLFSTAMISSNGDEKISKLVTDSINKVTADGSITIEDSNTSEDELKVIPGIEINKGYTSNYFINDDRTGECILKNPLILVFEGRIREVDEAVHLLQLTCAASTQRPLVIIADAVESDALGLIITNRIKAKLNVCIVSAPYYGVRRLKCLTDIAHITGAQYVAANAKLTDLTVQDFGTCEKIVIGRNSTTIHNGKNQDSQEFKDYIEGIKNQIPSIVNTFEQDQEKERVAKLIGGIAVIRVGGLTEPEVNERKDRVDDALHACKAAMEGGSVIGGGKILYNASKMLEDQLTESKIEGAEFVGYDIVAKALRSPIELLFSNSGYNFNEIKERIDQLKFDESLDLNDLSVINLRSKKIIDPSKVTVTALNNARSIVELLISTECIVLTEQ